MKEKRITCEKARNICIVNTLATLGHFPSKESEKEAWFPSPFRSETQASFKVSKTLNRWYDHGEGIGGNVIDLICKLKQISVKETLEFLSDNNCSFSFQQHHVKKELPKIEITQVLPIRHPAILDYLTERKIPPTLAHGYLKQVHFILNSKKYFALGMQNNKGGWELRNKFQKHCCSPKATTLIGNKKQDLTVVEGMFDFLSLLVIQPKWFEESDVLVLNSLSFASKIGSITGNYDGIYLALDNDEAGEKWTQFLTRTYPRAVDKRKYFAGFKDINEKLIAHGKQ